MTPEEIARVVFAKHQNDAPSEESIIQIMTEAVEKGMAQAWDEGYEAGDIDAGDGWNSTVGTDLAESNPYRGAAE